MNIKYNARFQVLTPVLLRYKSSGMQQCVNAYAVRDIFRNLQTLTVNGNSPLTYRELLTPQYRAISQQT